MEKDKFCIFAWTANTETSGTMRRNTQTRDQELRKTLGER